MSRYHVVIDYHYYRFIGNPAATPDTMIVIISIYIFLFPFLFYSISISVSIFLFHHFPNCHSQH